ncbi:MAG: hypothetical protein IPO27_14125 [Bacteroidetes bacterium]|nr:hypothetical protein [Bacteroidota bacterium]
MYRFLTFILLLAFAIQAIIHPISFFLKTTFFDHYQWHTEYISSKTFLYVADGTENYLNNHEVILNEKIYDIISISQKNDQTVLMLFDDKEEQAEYNHYNSQKEKGSQRHATNLMLLLFAEEPDSIKFILSSLAITYHFISFNYTSPNLEPLYMPPWA